VTARPGRFVGAALAAVLAAVLPPVPLPASPDSDVSQLRLEVLATYPHDPDAFTQGLELHDGLLYESTGRYGRSDVRITEVKTGQVRLRVGLPEDTFGEGLTVVGDTVWQLTWREGVAFVRDRDTLAERDRIRYDGEGWGLCYDHGGGRLVMSDGSDRLTFRDPRSFEVLGAVEVRLHDQPLRMLNELECLDGAVWANVWLTADIVRIDLSTGAVTAVVDASGLLPPEQAADADVLNGIAAVPGTDTFLITGKLWPTVFLVRFEPWVEPGQ
jgi:glutaminyl-peptide cyclotransferase